MQSLKDGEDAMLRLDQMEALYYKLQLQLYDIQAEVLQCEEMLLTTQLQSLRRQMTGGHVVLLFRSYVIILSDMSKPLLWLHMLRRSLKISCDDFTLMPYSRTPG